MNTHFQKKAGRKWTWRSPDGNTENEIDCIVTDKPSMVTNMTGINGINVGSDHRMLNNGLRYAKHQTGKEETPKQELTGK